MVSITRKKIEVRPLMLGYLAMVETYIEEKKIKRDICTLANRLYDEGFLVNLHSDDEIELLLDYWKEHSYFETKDSGIRLRECKRHIFNKKFVINNLFDPGSIPSDSLINAYSEVLSRYED